MTDKPVKLGALEIRNAKKLFEKSVADGKPDYRYPALVIGENPLVPPKWAMKACIEERRRTERRSASAASDPDGEMLDVMAVLLLEHAVTAPKAGSNKRSKSLRSLIWEAAEQLDRVNHDTNDDTLRTYERAWTKEQKFVGAQTQLVCGYKLTPRISRIKEELFGEEFGTSKDPAADAYWQYRKNVMHVSD
tara:strand:- start:7425 stop:7997 length:573 start_codon:yes stop_codon:yes gene_type:complete